MQGVKISLAGDLVHTFVLCAPHASRLRDFVNSQGHAAELVSVPKERVEMPEWGVQMLDKYACYEQLGLPLKTEPFVSSPVLVYFGLRCAEMRIEGKRRIPIPTTAVWIGSRTVAARELDPRYDLVNHSPDGFEWGYEGSGPAQLALAILADSRGEEFALKHYHQFKSAQIANIRAPDWFFQRQQVLEWTP